MMIPLQAGDVLLYKPVGVFGRIIAIKTWHSIAHCECALNDHESVASRDGIGVNVYPHRDTELVSVLRPNIPFDAIAAMAWFNAEAKGKPYGWLDLAAFVGLPWHSSGMFCSEFVTTFLRKGGVHCFEKEPPEKIAPFEFLLSEVLTEVWSVNDGSHDRQVVTASSNLPVRPS